MGRNVCNGASMTPGGTEALVSPVWREKFYARRSSYCFCDADEEGPISPRSTSGGDVCKGESWWKMNRFRIVQIGPVLLLWWYDFGNWLQTRRANGEKGQPCAEFWLAAFGDLGEFAHAASGFLWLVT